jgi:hypothetical protein
MLQALTWLPWLLRIVSIISLFMSVSYGVSLVETRQVYMQAQEEGEADVAAPSIMQYAQTILPALLTVVTWLTANKIGSDSVLVKVLEQLRQFIGKGGDPAVIIGPSPVVPGADTAKPSAPIENDRPITRLQAIDALLHDLKTSDDEDTAIDLTITNGGKKRRLYYGPVNEPVPAKKTPAKV